MPYALGLLNPGLVFSVKKGNPKPALIYSSPEYGDPPGNYP